MFASSQNKNTKKQLQINQQKRDVFTKEEMFLAVHEKELAYLVVSSKNELGFGSDDLVQKTLIQMATLAGILRIESQIEGQEILEQGENENLMEIS